MTPNSRPGCSRHLNLSLGAAIRPGDGETPALAVALAPVVKLACRRDLPQGPRAKWAYLYRALDKFGNTLDFYLSATRNTKAAKRFLDKALRGGRNGNCPKW